MWIRMFNGNCSALSVALLYCSGIVFTASTTCVHMYMYEHKRFDHVRCIFTSLCACALQTEPANRRGSLN